MNRRLYFERRAATVLFFFLKNLPSRGLFLLPANVCPIVPAVFILSGHRYEMVDINPKSLYMDKPLIMKRLQKGGCEGVFWVHTYGAIDEDIENYFTYIRKHYPKLTLIDDRCLARPSSIAVNSQADLELYSTGYSKFVDLGWGGWGFTPDKYCLKAYRTDYEPDLHNRLVSHFRDVLSLKQEYTPPDGIWLDTHSPSITWNEFWKTVQLSIDISHQHRLALSRIYRKLLPAEHLLPATYDDWRVHVFVDNPEMLVTAIFSSGGFASRHYASLVPGFGSGIVPVTKFISSRVVNLFNDFRYDTGMAQQTAETVCCFIENQKNFK